MDREHWRVDKRINLSMVLSALIVLGGGLVWAASVNRSIAVIEQQVTGLTKDIQETRNYVTNTGRCIQ